MARELQKAILYQSLTRPVTGVVTEAGHGRIVVRYVWVLEDSIGAVPGAIAGTLPRVQPRS